MQKGLEGRRIAVYAAPGADAAYVRRELIAAGATVNDLQPDSPAEHWHGGMYAGLVIVGRSGEGADERLAQLVREFLVTEKPVAAADADVEALRLDETLLAVRGSGDPDAFAREVAREFGKRLEEGEIDAMSDMSFPASDPPAVNPGTAGPGQRGGGGTSDRDSDSRP